MTALEEYEQHRHRIGFPETVRMVRGDDDLGFCADHRGFQQYGYGGSEPCHFTPSRWRGP